MFCAAHKVYAHVGERGACIQLCGVWQSTGVDLCLQQAPIG